MKQVNSSYPDRQIKTANNFTLYMFEIYTIYTGFTRYNFVTGLLFVTCGLFLHRFDISISFNDDIFDKFGCVYMNDLNISKRKRKLTVQ